MNSVGGIEDILDLIRLEVDYLQKIIALMRKENERMRDKIKRLEEDASSN